MANSVMSENKKEKEIMCNLGDVFLIDGEVYMLVCVDNVKANLISLRDGIRWTDAFVFSPNYRLGEIVEIVKRNDDEDCQTEVAYIGACSIKISKLGS